MRPNKYGYGLADGSYQAAGEIAGITRLVDDFYDQMEALPEAATIRNMHPKDLTKARQKLSYFLSGWLGGPKLFSQNFGPINIPDFHKHFPIGDEEREAWLICMRHAIAQQPYEQSFKDYLLVELRVPAERIKQRSQAHAAK